MPIGADFDALVLDLKAKVTARDDAANAKAQRDNEAAAANAAAEAAGAVLTDAVGALQGSKDAIVAFLAGL